MYDPLYTLIPRFTGETGIAVEVVAHLPHPELNHWVDEAFSRGEAPVDLLSTHTKYAPSQEQWLSSIEDVVPPEDVDDLLERPLTLSRFGGRLLQVPRNLDVRLLHYRTDLIDAPPSTWGDLAEVAAAATRGSVSGFLFPGRDSGLFGTFYELLVGEGGELFDERLQPAFHSAAGLAAMRYLHDLHSVRRVTPRELPAWHYDEISIAFRQGRGAMVCDWPGSYHLYVNRTTCAVADRVGLAALPAGSTGARPAYAGCHSFAIPTTASNREGAARLLRYLTSFEAQLLEARQGAIPCRVSALAAIRDEQRQADAAARWQLLSDAIDTMIIPPRFAAYPKCEDAIWHAAQDAMVGRATADEAIARAAADVAALVKEA